MTDDEVEARAIILRDRAEVCPATRITEPEKAMAYFRADARSRLANEEKRRAA